MRQETAGAVIGSVILWAIAPVLAVILLPSALCMRAVQWSVHVFKGNLR